MFTQLQRMTLAQARCWLKLSMSFLFLISIYTRKKKVWLYTHTNTFGNNGLFYWIDSTQLKYFSSDEYVIIEERVNKVFW